MNLDKFEETEQQDVSDEDVKTLSRACCWHRDDLLEKKATG